MRPHFRFEALARIADPAQRRSALAKAVAFNFALPSIVLDTLGDAAPYVNTAAANDANFVGVKNFTGAAVKAPTREQFLATLQRKYATPDQNPNLTGPTDATTSWFHNNMPELDVGYLALFDLVDMRGSQHTQFDIRTTAAGITWAQREPGQRASIRREFSEGKVDVPFLEFTTGVGILDVWLDFNKFWNISEIVAEFMATEQQKRAALHYGLFTALSSAIDVAFATDDTTTFNAAAAAILRALTSSGYAPGPNAQFDILCAPEKVGRILAMLDAKRGSPMIAFGTQNQPIAYSVRNVISSTHVTAGDTGYYLVLPGRKIKRGTWLDVTLESQRDITASAQDWVGKTRYNAAIADTGQVRRVKYA